MTWLETEFAAVEPQFECLTLRLDLERLRL